MNAPPEWHEFVALVRRVPGFVRMARLLCWCLYRLARHVAGY